MCRSVEPVIRVLLGQVPPFNNVPDKFEDMECNNMPDPRLVEEVTCGLLHVLSPYWSSLN